jgi:hypothetical protein
MDTRQILATAYADIFAIPVNSDGHYHDQRTKGGCVIDYAHFDYDVAPFVCDDDFIEAVVEDGCEGVYVRVERIRYDRVNRRYDRLLVGTIKTLDEGRGAWAEMGALAGELAYMSNKTAWELDRKEREAQKDR